MLGDPEVEDVVDEIGVFKLLGEDVLLGLEESEAEPNEFFNVVKAIGFTTLGVPGVEHTF